MKPLSVLLALSFTLNAALLWHCLTSPTRPAESPFAPVVVPPPARPVQPSMRTSVPVEVAPIPVPMPPATNRVGFHWSQLPVGDLRQLIARLRPAGCPDETLFDFFELEQEIGRAHV